MMSLSDRRHDIVDLTLDSDDEDEVPSSFPAVLAPSKATVPLPGSSKPPNASTPTAPPKNQSVPVPGSTPRDTPVSILAHGTQTANGVTLPTISSRPSSATNAASISQSKATRKSYVPVPISIHDGANDGGSSDRAEKRRKLSTHGGQTQAQGASNKAKAPIAEKAVNASQQGNAGPPSRRGSGHAMHAQSESASSRLSNASTSTNILNKTLSVQYMNTALKTSGATTSLVNNVATSGPRPLQIGRMPEGGAVDLPSPSLSTPGAASTAPTDPVPYAYSVAQRMQTTKSTNNAHNNSIHVLRATPQTGNRGQSAGPVQAARTEGLIFREEQPRNSYFSGAVPAFQDEDVDSVMSDASLPAGQARTGVSARDLTTSQQPSPAPSAKAVSHKPTQSKLPVQFSEEEEHLLIFLKEVKKLPWKLITPEFNKDYPGRPYHTLQSRYTTKTNKRDRSQDPTVLNLPPRWAGEAAIDWPSVYAKTSGPRERFEVANSRHDAGTAIGVAPKPTFFRQTTDQDYSSGTDSGVRQQRPRRAPPVNYDIRRRNMRLGDETDNVDFDDVMLPHSADPDTPMRSESPSDTQAAIPGKAHVVINEPLEMHFTADDAGIGLIARKGAPNISNQKIPYLNSLLRSTLQDPPQRWDWDQLTSREWQGSLLHVDFSPEELGQVQRAISQVWKTPQKSRHNTQRRHLRALLKDVSEPKLLHLVRAIQRHLPARDSSSIKALLDDARAGNMTEVPRILRLSAARPQKSNSVLQTESTTSLLRQREVGSSSRRGWKTATKPITYQTRNKVMDTLGPSSSWTGASSDIHTVSWSHDGEYFAAGAVAVTDRDSMQYNRPNNLLFGNLSDLNIHELAEHSIERHRTDSGANSSHAMFVSQDPELYTTVTSVSFAPSGKIMYSAGYDESVCVWHLDSSPSQPTLEAKLRHKGEVEMMVVNRNFDGVLATAAKKSSGSAIKLLTFNEDDPSQFEKHNFHSEKAISRSDLRILPQALQFEPSFGGLLLAGFGANVREDNSFDLTGDLCLWDIETQAQIPIHGSNRNVFDVSFNPNRRYMPLFAAGCVAGGNVNRGTRSVIRLYDEKGLDKYTCPLEIECRALDMNDVVWCPQDEHLIAAGCTDGRVYVWDMRRPDDPLRTLSHGRSLMPLQEGIHHERTDTGIRFLSWGDNATRLYSGSSDGIVKVWDVTRSEEDTFIKDLITVDSGIMAGAFSPDYSKLVLGEVNGSVNVLDVGRDDCNVKDAEKLRYVRYAGDVDDQDPLTGNPIHSTAADSGVTEGKYLLQSQQLQVIPMGSLPIHQVVQGIRYAGPFDQSVDAPFLREQALEFQLNMTQTSGSQCNIAACKNNIVKVTSEEIGDSGRSSDRIPDELRRQWTAVDTNTRIMPGKSKCTHCGRPARPSPSDDPDASVLCERCSFACFRCGAVNPIAAATTTLICDSCAGVWEIGALGYECIEQPALTSFNLDVPPLRRFGKDILLARSDDKGTTFGDGMNALTDYYHSLAIDRPESPPL